MGGDTRPLVSICIPVYNGAAFIAETLKSVSAQSVANIEIIVSDNASTDGTDKIIAEIARMDTRIIYTRNDTNIGYTKNIAAAVAKASAEYVAIYHADDIYHPRIVERELQVLSSDPGIAGVFCLPAVFSTNPKKAIKKRFYSTLYRRARFFRTPTAIVGTYEDYFPLILEFGNIFACPSFMTRRSVFLELGGFTDRYPSNEDFELWVRYLQSGWKLGIVNRFLLNYRLSDSQGSALWRRKPELGKMYSVLDELVVGERVLSTSEKKKYQKNLSIGYARVAFEMAMVGKRIAARKFAAASKVAIKLWPNTFWFFVQRSPTVTSAVVRRLSRLKKLVESFR